MSNKVCQRCQSVFSCGANSANCWCMALPAAKNIPANFFDCLCAKCLNEFSNQKTETEDYYLDENGLLVFTETYHLKRGTCCHNNCKHCPYTK